EDDPLKRAKHLGALAEKVASEIGTAAQGHEPDRVDELGKHLETLLREGMVNSLKELEEKAPPGSSLDQKLKEVQRLADAAVRQIEEKLARTTDHAVKEQLR